MLFIGILLQTSFCNSENTDLVESGRLDCEDKCKFKSCPEPCDDDYFCSYFNFQDGPCQPCETLIAHPEHCDSYGEFPDAGLKEIKQLALQSLVVGVVTARVSRQNSFATLLL